MISNSKVINICCSLRLQRIMGEITQKPDRFWSAIFCVIDYFHVFFQEKAIGEFVSQIFELQIDLKGIQDSQSESSLQIRYVRIHFI